MFGPARRWAPAAFVIAGLAFTHGTAQAAAPCQLQQLTELPVTMVGTRPTIHVSINGQDAVFLVDSGAFYSTIAKGELARFALKEEPIEGFGIIGVGGYQSASATTINKFALGEVGLGRRQIVVANGMGPGLSGLIGQDILAILDTEFDLANGAIRILKPKDCIPSANLAYWARGKDSAVPMQSQNGPLNRAITAHAKVNGKDIKVKFDTGASLSGLTLHAAARAGVTPTTPGVVPAGVMTGFGRREVKTWLGSFQSFALGDEEIRTTRLRIYDTDLTDGDDMLLGADFFLSHRVLVSQSQRRIYFTYNGGPVFRLDTPLQSAAADSPAKAAETPQTAAAPALEPDALARRAAASLGRRDVASALRDLDQAIMLRPEDPSLYVHRAEARMLNRQPVLAMADLDEALKRKPDQPDALVLRAQVYLSQQDRVRAKADVDAAAKLKIAEPHLRLVIAGLYEVAGDHDDSIASFDLWIRDHPEDAELPAALNGACWNRAVLKKDLDRALKDCDAAIRLRPGAADILDSRGLVHLDRGELDKAIADYDAALKIRPKGATTLYARGVAKQRKGLKDDGDADIKAATALNPRVAEVAKRDGLIP